MRRRPVQLFLIGAVVGALLMGVADTDLGLQIPIPFYWILVPGLLLTTPLLFLTGGVHGEFTGLIFVLVPVVNGFVYLYLERWIRRRRAKP